MSHDDNTNIDFNIPGAGFLFLEFFVFWFYWVLVAALEILVVACRLLSRGMRAGSSSQTRDGTQASCTGSMESYSLDHQGSPIQELFLELYVS